MTSASGVSKVGTQSGNRPPASASRKCAGFCIAAVSLLTLILAGCSGDNKTSAARANVERPVPVSVATAELRDMPYYLTGLGSVSAYYTVSVKSRVDGELTQVNFKEGQFVNQGELIAIIDPRPFQVQLEQAQATLFKDQATLRDAKLNLERFKGLLQNSGAMSQQQVDTQAALVDQLEGTVRTDQAAIDNAKLQLTYCHITSPVSGRIGLRQVDPGNMVHANDTNPMFIITQLQPIAVLFTLPEDNLPAVAQHMAKSTLEVDAYSRDNTQKLATGKLLTIDNQIDPTTGTGKLKAVFDNKDNSLWPNQFVNARLLLEIRKNSTIVPAAAIQRGPQGTYVFAESNNAAQIRPVTVAFTQDNESVITTGLSPKDVVIVDGQDKLQDGSVVEIRQSGGATKAQAGATSSSPASSSGGNATSGSTGSPTR